MAFLEFIWAYAIWVAVPGFFLGVALLVWCIVDLVRVIRASVLIRLPLAAENPITVNQPGPVVLCIEGPLFSTRFAGFGYDMVSENGEPVPCRRLLFRATTSGFTTARMELRRFRVDRPGDYTLRVTGIGEHQPRDSEHHFVLVKPHLPAVLAHILGIIASAWLTIGSIVMFGIKVAGVE